MSDNLATSSFLTSTLAHPFAGSDLLLVTSGLVEGLVNTKTISRLSQDAFRVDSMVTVLKVLMDTALSLQKDFDKCMNHFVPKLSKGIASIPDELVSLIFKCATHRESTLREALRLSHVSKRFRRIALAEHCLWTTLRSDWRTEALETCIARSGHKADLHVIIHLRDHLVLSSFIDICWPTASRWKTLTVSEGEVNFNSPFNEELAVDVLKAMDDLQLLRLHELHLRYYRESMGDGFESRFKPSWSAPNLRVLQCIEYVPAPSNAFSALTSVAISIYSGSKFANDVRRLFSFLASTPTVTSLDLEITDIESPEAINFGTLRNLSITSFNLNLPFFHIGGSKSQFVATFIKALHLPKLEELSFSIEFICEGYWPRYNFPGVYRELLAKSALAPLLLPDCRSHPRLRQLTFKLICTHSLDLSRTLKESFDFFSRVLVAFIQTHFLSPRSSVVGRGNTWDLRELRLRGCENLDGQVLQEEMIQSLKDIGVCDGLELFVLEDGKASDQTIELYVEESERAQRSAKENLAFVGMGKVNLSNQ